jgi:hypothetical protein
VSKKKKVQSPREYGLAQDPKITKHAVIVACQRKSIPGAKLVEYRQKNGRIGTRWEIPIGAVRIPGVLGRPRKEQAKQPRKGAEKRER